MVAAVLSRCRARAPRQFAEAPSDLFTASLIEMALLLFVVTLIVNIIARLLVGSHTVAAGKQCVDGQCILDPLDRCGGGVCPADYPNCGPDGRCWTKPCADLCGAGCCGGSFPICGGDGLCHPPDACGDGTCPADYPHCGTDGRCWSRACDNLCGADNCCGGDHPICKSDGLCYPDGPTGGGGGVPTDLPPGNYTVSMCVSGYVSLPCQVVGSIPFHGVALFQTALNTVINQWLAATAGLPDCTRGATTYSPYDGSSFTVTFSVTCSSPSGSVSETVNITVQHT